MLCMCIYFFLKIHILSMAKFSLIVKKKKKKVQSTQIDVVTFVQVVTNMSLRFQHQP